MAARGNQGVLSLVEALEEDGFGKAVGTNEMEGRIYVRGRLPWKPEERIEVRPWGPVDDSYGFAYAQERHGCQSERTFQHALALIADRHRFNPLLDALGALPAWDGAERVGTLLSIFLGVRETEYTSEVERLLFRAALARAYRPGCKFDSMVVLTGPQGIGKSTFLRRLALRPAFFTDSVTGIGTKQAAELVQGKWIVELSELSAMRASALEAVKAFITRQADDFRAPYARHAESRPRRFILTGTTNAKAFLTDTSGNRRFLPITCGETDAQGSLFEKGAGVFFQQAWAEALHDFKAAWPQSAAGLYLNASLADVAEEARREAKIDDPRVGLIEDYLETLWPGREVCVVEVMEEALKIERERQRKAEQMEVTEIMATAIDGLTVVSGKQRTANYGVQKVYRWEGKRDE